ncbi:MAG: hypothetical protein U0836_07750 [Pirellulales bacterium]
MCFAIQVLDADTRRGVPLVELTSTSQVRYVTDSAGWAAIDEPALNGQKAFFSVKSHGYEFPADGLGFRGRALDMKTGDEARLEIKRINIAERLYRVTGEGIYHDSVRLGKPTPLEQPLLNAQVTGQDSAQAVVYRGKIHWFWGDTNQVRYPLGNFRTSGAVSELPGNGGLDPSVGVNLRYFVDATGFSKKMCPLDPPEGVVWIDGVAVVLDAERRERLVAHFTRLKGLGEMLEHGAVLYNDERDEFERAAAFDFADLSRCPHGQSFVHRDGDAEYVYFGNPFPNVRVRRTLAAVLDTNQYEAFTCLPDGTAPGALQAQIERDAEGRPHYRWTKRAPPLRPEDERRLIAKGAIKEAEARWQPVDTESGKPVSIHYGGVQWNPWRQRWIMIAAEQGGTSFLGETWYAEAREMTGPWPKARKLVTHDRYSFYNPVHHPFFDQEGGRVIYFEGTYSHTFSGNDQQTPRYDYNQIMYRVDLSDPRLAPAHSE